MGRKRDDQSASAPVVGSAPNNPFASLASLRGTLPAGSRTEVATPAPVATQNSAKVVITRERKGRGGKTVTLVRGFELSTEALSVMARDMRHALGTGGTLEDTTIVLNGDQSQRAADWLRQRGLQRIVIGN